MAEEAPCLPSRLREGQLREAQRGGPDRARDTLRAKELRNRATLSERRLWNALKSRQVGGAKFSRQMPAGPFFCDFLCREHKLAVEVDGPSHDYMTEGDANRTRYLNAQGLRVLRFTNEETTFGLEGVIAAIAAALPPTPASLRFATPLASGRGDR